MTLYAAFRARLDALPALAAADSARFGEGTRLLVSCRTGNILHALETAEALGIGARGVGRMHVLIEIDDAVPDAAWVATKGREIADYVERINGIDPQIGVDRAVA